MTQSKNKTVRITPKTDKKILSAVQKQFNSLTKKIDQQKKLLLEWKETIPLYRQKIDAEYEPLDNALNKHRADMVQLFDQHYDNSLFKKTDKAKIKHLICSIAENLIAEFDMDELKPLFNKYSGEDYDVMSQENEAAIGDMMKSIVENMLNLKLGDDADFSSPEKFQAHLKEKLREQAEAASPVNERKKTKKQLEKEAREQEEEALASKSVREVYRKLVAVLHPDREQDEQERERKTELMQRVNTAYSKKDLLQLLALQLEIEQIDPAHLSHIADNRLKHFNKILKEQLAELEQENHQIEAMFKMDLQQPFYVSLSPKRLMTIVTEDIQTVQEEIAAAQKELDEFQNPTALKAWLKSYKIPKNTDLDDFDDLLFGSGMMF
ncbi:hypothetical protein BCS42_00890 [Crenothrix sp. D3]|nr:hypothetical protein BCS42_00890 [Crenothrix sp. D3]